MNDQPEKPSEGEAASVPAVRRERVPVSDSVPLLDTHKFDHMGRIAKAMADSSLIPKDLFGNNWEITVANCFLVVNQAVRWEVDPFALAQHAFVLRGKLGYEGKVVAAVINKFLRRESNERLKYAYEGEGKNRKITVSAQGDSLTGTVEEWATNNENWKKSPDQMLSYRGAREWARRYRPEIILGVLADDELEQAAGMRDITPPPPPPEELPSPVSTASAGEDQEGQSEVSHATETDPSPGEAQSGLLDEPSSPGELTEADHTRYREDAFTRIRTATERDDVTTIYHEVVETAAFAFPGDRDELDKAVANRLQELDGGSA